jgi:hypothetical protein
MAMMAAVFPIMPGKTGQWREFIAELNGARRAEFVDSRERAGVRERTFLQSTPMGDLVIVTLEGDDPARSFGQLLSADSPFAIWFKQQAQSVHGIDTAAIQTAPPAELVADTGEVAALAR